MDSPPPFDWEIGILREVLATVSESSGVIAQLSLIWEALIETTVPRRRLGVNDEFLTLLSMASALSGVVETLGSLLGQRKSVRLCPLAPMLLVSPCP